MSRRYIERQADFVDPRDYAAPERLTPGELETQIAAVTKGRDVYAAAIESDHPPSGIERDASRIARISSG